MPAEVAAPSSGAPGSSPGPAAPATSNTSTSHIRLTSHAGGHGALPIHWGAATPAERGPVVGTTGPRGGKHDGLAQSMAKSAVRTMGSAVGREIIRGVLGSIFGGKKR